MADLIVNKDGSISVNSNKKKKNADLVVTSDGQVVVNRVSQTGGNSSFGSSTKKTSSNKNSNKRTWFKGGAFSDGYDFGDITRTLVGTSSDIQGSLATGVGKILEGTVDTGAWVVGKTAEKLGNQKLADKTKDFIERDFIEETNFKNTMSNYGKIGLFNSVLNGGDHITSVKNEAIKSILDGKSITETLKKSGTSNTYEKSSILGDKSDNLVQSAGQLAGTIGLQAAGIPWWLTTATTSFGGETQNAFKSGATYNEAGFSGLVTAGAEVLTEKLSGGISFGGKTLDKGLKNSLTKNITNKTLNTLVKFGFDAAGEGAEEVLSEVISNVGKKLSYEDDKTWKEMLVSEEAMDNYLEAFIGGAVLGGAFNISKAANSIKTGRDYDTGLSTNEEKVVNKEVENRIAEKEESGTKLTTKEKNKIRKEVMTDLNKGYISTDFIEKTLATDTYNTYKSTQEKVEKIKNEIKELEDKNLSDMSVGEWNTTTEQISTLKEELSKIDVKTPKTTLDAEIDNLLSKDYLLQRSYQENSNRGVQFTADINNYTGKQQEVVQKAIDSGILNNTNKTHEFVDMVAKISADKGVSFDFTNNEKLKESGFAIDGKQVNGFVNQNGVTVNIDSDNALNSIVGHEITHILEGTDLYNELQAAVKDYATSKGEYETRLAKLTEMYKDVENANVENELTADLVGEYLFTDADFVNNLSVQKPSTFKKIWEEVKYLYKVATAGSREARQLEKVKKTFEEAYRNSGKTLTNDTKYALNIDDTSYQGKEFDRAFGRGITADNFLNKQENKIADNSKDNIAALEQLEKVRNNPDADITIYRATPSNSINTGDWVFLNKEQAERWTKSTFGTPKPGYKVVEEVVKAKDVDWTGKNLEFVYNPQNDTKYSISDTDNKGRKLSEAQKEYFKDSKVVDNEGHLQRMYHGSPNNFTVFDNNKIGSTTGANLFGEGFYFTPYQSEASNYRDGKKGKIYSTYLNITNPYVVTSESEAGTINSKKLAEQGYDGIELRTGFRKSNFIAFNSNQIKNVDNTNPTTNEDIRMSLSEQGIAPTKQSNLIYGEDVKLEDAIAPLQDTVDNLSQKIDDIADKMDKQLLGTPITEEDIPYVEQQANENINNYNDIPEEEGTFSFASPEIEIKNKGQVIDEIRSNLNIKIKDAQELYNKISSQENITIDDVAAELENYKDFITTYDDPNIKEIRNAIRNTTIDVSSFKNQITDYGYFRRANMGRLRLGNSGVKIDSFYQELSNMYQGYLDPNANTEADQLQALSDFMFKDTKVEEKYSIDSDTLYQLASDIYANINNYDLYKAANRQSRETAKQLRYMEIPEDIASNTEEIGDIAPTKDTNKETTIEEDLVSKTKKELRQELMGTEAQKEFIKSVLDNAKNRSMALMNNTDTIRNTELVFGRENGNIINKLIFQKELDNEASSIKWQNEQRKEIKNLGIKARSKESAAVQKYGEKQYINENGIVMTYDDSQLASEFPNVETQNKIKNAAKELRNKYDDYIELANGVLTKLGFDPIKKRTDYMRHFQELNDVFSRYGMPFNAQSMNEHTLPTDINGLTEYWSPQKNYFANMQPRKGVKTTYDAITGIDGYISGISNLIYHTEDIQRGRAFEELIRETYGEEKGFENLENLPDELKSARAEKIQDNHLSNYAAWLHEWTNNVAGKKNKIDRSIEAMFGRKAFSFLDGARKQVGSNMIGLNLASSMTNLIAPVQAASKTNKLALARGTADTIKNIFIKDNFSNENKFLVNRMGTDMISKTPWAKMQDAGYVFMKGMDWFSSNMIVRSKYYENLSKGMDQQTASDEAGKFAARILGDRTKGANAQLYNSKLLGLVTQFQLEVNNQLYSQFYDTYHESKENAKGSALKTAAGMTFTLGQLAAFTHIFGQTFEAIAGYNPTFDVIEMIKIAFGWGDDEGEEKTTSENLQSAAKVLVGALPYVNILSGGGRIPVASAIPNLVGVATGGKDEYGNKLTLKDEAKKLMYLLPPTGANQVKKTVQGLSMYNEDLPVKGSYNAKGDLKYTADESTLGKVQAAIFGKWANSEAQNYIDSGFKSIAASKIDEMKDLGMKSSEYRKLNSEISKSGTKTADKVNYITSRDDLTNDQKNILVNNILDRDYDVDTSNYSDYGSYEEFDYSYKNPEKYQLLKENNISYKDYSSNEDIKEAVDWAYRNPEKYQVAKAITNDIVTYKQISSDLSDITADKNANGKSISGSRKQKVFDYINSTNLSFEQKVMLAKMEYPTYNEYNNDIVEYLNNNNNITYDEEVSILEELGFKVDAMGNISW